MRTALLLPLLALTACTYDRDRMVAVCSDGKGYSRAAPYQPQAAAGDDYPVAIVKRFAGLPEWVADNSKRFYDQGVPSPDDGNYRRAQLALCVEQQPGPFNRECEMDEGIKVKVYDSHYILTVREAQTGRAVATRTVDVKAEHCPIVVLGNTRAELTRPDYQQIDDEELVTTLLPYLPPKVRERLTAPPPQP
jgi:hypothetical protein